MGKKKKPEPKPKETWKLYTVKGNSLERKNETCIKCGPGTFMAKHKDRKVCGKCGYTEFTKIEN